MFGSGVRWLCTAAVAVSASVSGATAAGADPAPEGKELVVLGDSFSANVWNIIEQETDCRRHGPTAWPTQLGKLMGVDGTDRMSNPSCPGASIDSGPGWTLAMQAKRADEEGAFGPRTKVVTFQFGMNDKWGKNEQTMWNSLQQCVFNVELGCGPEAVDEGRIPDYNGVSGKLFAERMRNAVTYIRYYAPNARLVLVGYPELFVSGSDTVCLNFFGVAPFVNPRGRAAVEYFDRIDRAQREAAEILGLEFIDARALTAGHGLCSATPWVNGVFDPRADFGGLFFHPSTQGDAVVANAIHAGR
ncbi:SGNH/GDSL hydrolase family protein [Nocardia sp. NPDC003693]